MKRAKIMLLAITIVAVVGGVLAFRAQKFADKNVYCATIINGQLTCSTSDFKTTLPGNPSFTTPCSTWHGAPGIGLTTTSYYTTTACLQILPVPAVVTPTFIQ